MGFVTMTSFNSGLKLNPRLKPNLKPDQINWVHVMKVGERGTRHFTNNILERVQDRFCFLGTDMTEAIWKNSVVVWKFLAKVNVERCTLTKIDVAV